MRLIDADVLLELLGKAENLYLERGEWEHYGFLASIMGQIEKQPTITRFSKTKKAAPAMNDKEIIKALECCCVAEQQICRESKCPLFGNGNCFTELAINVLDLINRQKAEIERLEKDRDEYPFKCKVGNNSEIHSKSIQDYDRVIKDAMSADFLNLETLNRAVIAYTFAEGEDETTDFAGNYTAAPISCMFQTKLFDMGSPEKVKTFDRLYIGFGRTENLAAGITYVTEKGSFEDSYIARAESIAALHTAQFVETQTLTPNMRCRRFAVRVENEGEMYVDGLGLSYKI